MFLTKKGFGKILLGGICFLVAGGAFVLLARQTPEDAVFLRVLGEIMLALCPLVIWCGYYAEGKANLLNLGNRLCTKPSPLHHQPQAILAIDYS